MGRVTTLNRSDSREVDRPVKSPGFYLLPPKTHTLTNSYKYKPGRVPVESNIFETIATGGAAPRLLPVRANSSF